MPLKPLLIRLGGPVAVLAVAFAAHFFHWNDRALLWQQQRATSLAEQADKIWLPNYQAVIQGKALSGLERDETSGLTYNPATGTLFTVTGRNPLLVELSRQGEVLRRIELKGFSDPEAVEVLDNGLMAIADERRHTLLSFTLDDEQTELNAADLAQLDLGFANAGNKGFEGLGWDARSQRLLVAKERSPMGLFGLSVNEQGEFNGPLQTLTHSHLGVRDISSLSVDERTGHVLLLSDESNLLLELNRAGSPVSYMSLRRGAQGLEQRIKQAEGVAMDEHGDIYIVAEPNLFYRFSKPAPEAG